MGPSAKTDRLRPDGFVELPVIEVTRRLVEGGPVRLDVLGEVDLATVDVFAAAIADALDEFLHVEVDMSGVSFVDSTGLRALLEAAATCGESRRLVVVGASRQADHLFDITGVRELLGLPPRQN